MWLIFQLKVHMTDRPAEGTRDWSSSWRFTWLIVAEGSRDWCGEKLCDDELEMMSVTMVSSLTRHPTHPTGPPRQTEIWNIPVQIRDRQRKTWQPCIYLLHRLDFICHCYFLYSISMGYYLFLSRPLVIYHWRSRKTWQPCTYFLHGLVSFRHCFFCIKFQRLITCFSVNLPL